VWSINPQSIRAEIRHHARTWSSWETKIRVVWFTIAVVTAAIESKIAMCKDRSSSKMRRQRWMMEHARYGIRDRIVGRPCIAKLGLSLVLVVLRDSIRRGHTFAYRMMSLLMVRSRRQMIGITRQSTLVWYVREDRHGAGPGRGALICVGNVGSVVLTVASRRRSLLRRHQVIRIMQSSTRERLNKALRLSATVMISQVLSPALSSVARDAHWIIRWWWTIGSLKYNLRTSDLKRAHIRVKIELCEDIEK
jgi:hypothetical protein